eukprot:TRINITY_DN66717_c0_g1_i1.p1 TRINITY_DN66717_c0_g1~~TRINITY_DN66717_c0_g1_i1.p1  ORF type:complete len:217 (+),score=21.53 TRINITY_DN66717_c0_g1_i1:65-652(+)
MFCNMLMNGGLTAAGNRVLQTSTVRSLWRDWLKLRSVNNSASRGTGRVPGWAVGRNIGWSPLGHVRQNDKCLYMGGWSTSWAVYPKWRVATVSLSQTMVWFDVPNWKASRDELDSVIEAFQKRRRRRVLRLRQGHAKASKTGNTRSASSRKRRASAREDFRTLVSAKSDRKRKACLTGKTQNSPPRSPKRARTTR